MHAEYGVSTWTSPEWRGRAEAWLDEQLAETGRQRTGDITQPRVRPWGTLLHAHTDQGPVWLEAPGRPTAFEVGLYEVLQRAAPTRILKPIATDTDKSWIVLPDGGTPLREQFGERDLVETLVEVLPQYGQFQRDLSKHVDDLLAAGVTDMRQPKSSNGTSAPTTLTRTKPTCKPSSRNAKRTSIGATV